MHRVWRGRICISLEIFNNKDSLTFVISVILFDKGRRISGINQARIQNLNVRNLGF